MKRLKPQIPQMTQIGVDFFLRNLRNLRFQEKVFNAQDR